jgi:hypothetical protein
MLLIKVGLVDTTKTIDAEKMVAVAAALNVQVTRALPQFWSVSATVSHLPDPNNIPQGFWPVQLVKSLPPGEGGFHLTQHNQPYAKVIATPDSDDWTIDASHETIEMLVDPSGNRLKTADAIGVVKNKIQGVAGQYEYLVEACDPCEADNFGYQIDGITVSDFITPHFYDQQTTTGTRYSFTGAIKSPLEILPGGYITWVDPKDNTFNQILWVDPNGKPIQKNLGPATGASLRSFVENKTRQMVLEKGVQPSKKMISSLAAFRDRRNEVGRYRAKAYV